MNQKMKFKRHTYTVNGVLKKPILRPEKEISKLSVWVGETPLIYVIGIEVKTKEIT